jgi:hypothetical protein
MNLRSSKTKLFCETSLNNDRSTTHLTSELQYVLRSAQTTCFHRLPRMVADRNVTYTTSLCFQWLLQLNVDVSYSRVVPILAACTYDPLPKVVRVYMRSLFRVYMRTPDRCGGKQSISVVSCGWLFFLKNPVWKIEMLGSRSALFTREAYFNLSYRVLQKKTAI